MILRFGILLSLLCSCGTNGAGDASYDYVLKGGTVVDGSNSEAIKSNSTFSDSRQRPDGIQYIFVNGVLAAENNKLVNGGGGRPLLHKTK